MSINRKIIIIVDAYGPAKYFCKKIKQTGCLCIHLLSTPQPLKRLNLSDLNCYDETLCYSGEFDDIVKSIEDLVYKYSASLVAILPGVEPGVLLSDKLSYHFSLPNNGISKSLARRDKSMMADVLQAANIRVPNYCRSSNLEELFSFSKIYPWPLVLKPLDSAGTDGVYFCNSKQEIEYAFSQVIKSENNMGTVNQAVLLQTFLQGKEYMVNTVSCEGKHYISDIWYTDKKIVEGYSQAYDKNHLINSDSIEYDILKEYTFDVLNAMDIKFGPAHTEVIITSNGPVLVEVASRISGGVNPESNNICLGYDQIELTIESYLTPKIFLKRIGNRYPTKNIGLQIILSSKNNGKIISNKLLEQLAKMNNVIDFNLKFELGDIINRTIDLSSSLGIVNLVSDSEVGLLADYNRIQHLIEQDIQAI